MEEQWITALKKLSKEREIKVQPIIQTYILRYIISQGAKDCKIELYRRPDTKIYHTNLDDLEITSDSFNVHTTEGHHISIDNNERTIRTISISPSRLKGSKLTFNMFSHSSSLRKEVNESITKFSVVLPHDWDVLISKAQQQK